MASDGGRATLPAMKSSLWCSATVALLLLVPISCLHASAEGDDLRVADAELNAVYQKALDAMPDGDAKEKLRDSQRAWIAYRDAEVALYAALGTGGGGLKITQTELTEERTKRLRGIAEDARNGTTQ